MQVSYCESRHPASRASFIAFFERDRRQKRRLCTNLLKPLTSPQPQLLGYSFRFAFVKLVFRVRASTFTRNRWSKLSPLDARKTWRRKEIVRKRLTMLCLHTNISQLLSSLSHLGQILSYLCPWSLVTENLSFYKLINLRSRSQKSCKSTLNSDFLCPSIPCCKLCHH